MDSYEDCDQTSMITKAKEYWDEYNSRSRNMTDTYSELLEGYLQDPEEAHGVDIRMEKCPPANRYRWCDAVGGCGCRGCVRTVNNVHDWLEWTDRNPPQEQHQIVHIAAIRHQANCKHENISKHERFPSITACEDCGKWLECDEDI